MGGHSFCLFVFFRIKIFFKMCNEFEDPRFQMDTDKTCFLIQDMSLTLSDPHFKDIYKIGRIILILLLSQGCFGSNEIMNTKSPFKNIKNNKM